MPKGWYPGWVDSVEYGLSQGKSLPMLTWILKFLQGEDADGNEKERTLRWYTTLAGDAAGRSVASIAKLAPDLNLASFAPNEADEVFGGMEVNIRVTIRPDRDDRKIKRNNVADVVPLDEE